ncbi:mandelate racemase/muconate lactonizing enzyme family protein [Acuticoccus kalidii]|uniref:mandelate racemase/muconate lactonizing enzyme family protein n=1 Tax=Acuticoccus kalidii TaxID=2910977 RepID=UPI00210459F4|nr:enolase C-terminal domain-like protein [Acuticoccus kalidii]
MQIADYQVERVSLPDEDPDWQIAGHRIPTNDGCIFTLIAEDGTRGEGYAAAFAHLGTTQDDTFEALRLAGELIIGRQAFAIEAAMAAVNAALPGANPARAAVDCALHDLKARAMNVPLYELLGGKSRERVEVMRILALKAPDAMAERAARLAGEGYRALKVKLAGAVHEDVARVRAVREAVGADVRLSADANMAFDVADATDFAARVDELGVTMIEQPVPSDALGALREVWRSAIPLEADEAAASPRAVLSLAAHRSVDGINLKLARSGGILATLGMARMCEAGGLAYRMGANVGSQLLVAHALHVAVSLPLIDLPCELAEFVRLEGDPYRGIEIVDGAIAPPEGIGTGIERIRHAGR